MILRGGIAFMKALQAQFITMKVVKLPQLLQRWKGQVIVAIVENENGVVSVNNTRFAKVPFQLDLTDTTPVISISSPLLGHNEPGSFTFLT